jgi:hypothetical protein
MTQVQWNVGAMFHPNNSQHPCSARSTSGLRSRVKPEQVVERRLWRSRHGVQGVAGSNPAVPTVKRSRSG